MVRYKREGADLDSSYLGYIPKFKQDFYKEFSAFGIRIVSTIPYWIIYLSSLTKLYSVNVERPTSPIQEIIRILPNQAYSVLIDS
jgi:hypothetical protein